MTDAERSAQWFDLAGEMAARNMKLDMALNEIWNIVHTPTRDTKYRTAEQHFQADFDAIRKIISTALPRPPSNTPEK